MSDQPQANHTPRLTDSDRLRMLRAAGDAERSNRPRWMVILGALVLAIAAVYALLGFGERGRALESLRSARAADARLTLLLDQITTAAAPPEQGGIGPFDPLPNPQTLLEQFATRAGLDKPDPPTARREEVGDRISRRTFQYGSVRHPSPDALVRWLDSVEKGIPGMRVEYVDLRPNNARNGWELVVTFSRLETSS